eukprot:m.116753 g.116753  ORF g.116753 m.116753 type:complete len:66 (-) comp13617_c0_seq2:140-337(-)
MSIFAEMLVSIQKEPLLQSILLKERDFTAHLLSLLVLGYDGFIKRVYITNDTAQYNALHVSGRAS